MNIKLYDSIKAAQNGDQQAMMGLINKFNPLIKKYGYLSKEDDATNCLTLTFIEMIHKIKLSGFEKNNSEYAMLNYIKKSVRNSYYASSMQKRNSILDNAFEFDDEIKVSAPNQIFSFELNHTLNLLTQLQKKCYYS